MRLYPDSSGEYFDYHFINKPEHDHYFDADHLAQKIYKAEQNGTATDIKLNNIFLACGYAIQATKIFRQGQIDLAYTYLMDACYRSGIVRSLAGFEDTRGMTDKLTRQAMAKQGGIKSNAWRNALKQEIYAYVAQRASIKPWPSRRSAALNIARKLEQFPAAHKVSSTPEKAVTEGTLIEWLEAMPDSDHCFVRKRNSTKK